jgi:sulfonate transport system permease protein
MSRAVTTSDAVNPPAAPAGAIAPAGRPAVGRALRDRLAGLLVPVTVLVLWEVLARAGILPPNWFPSPSAIAETIRTLAGSGELARHISATLGRVVVGFLVGASLGTVVGSLTGCSKTLRKLLDPTLQSLRNIPSMAWVPLFLLWLGIQETSKVSLIALGAFFPVYLNLTAGLRGVDAKLVEVGEVFGLRGMTLIRRVVFPAALPSYIVGLRSGLGLAWMFVVAAEIMGASRGLGFLMIDGQQTGRADLIIAAVLLFAVFGKLSDYALEVMGRRLLRHQKVYGE